MFRYARVRRHGKLREEALVHLRYRLRELGLGDKPVHFVDHHLCHARGSYHALEREIGREALVFTLDGMGMGYARP